MRQWSWTGLIVVVLACAVGEPVRDGVPTPDPADPGPAVPGDVTPGATEADAAAAAEMLVAAQLAYDAAEVERALALAADVLVAYPATPSAAVARWVVARAAFARGDYETALEHASAYAAVQPAGSTQAVTARLLARHAEDMMGPAGPPALIGALLPRTGSRVLVRYGDWVLEGVELAVREFEQRWGRTVQLVVADDGGGTRTAEAVAELERRGVIAIIGPLLPQQLPMAAGARADHELVMISPTIPEAPLDFADVYSVNVGDTRGAQHLGRYAAEAGFTQAAVMVPRQADHERKAQAFTLEFEQAGGLVRAVVPYDSGTTTFDAHLRRILAAVGPPSTAVDTYGVGGVVGVPADSAVAAEPVDPWGERPRQEPFALFVSAPERDVRQIAPQIAYYGLDSAGVQVFGDEAWASSSLRRLVPARDLEGVIAAAHHAPDRADGLADPAFVSRYESAYRRSLENQLPALGYDAATLVLQALPNRLLTPAALSFRVRLLSGIQGATGRLSVRGQRVVRTPVLVVIRGGQLTEAPPPAGYRLPVPRPPLPTDTTGRSGR